ncbi:MAG: aldehyde:ferredoxin oxidoreductase [Chloroflexi bacterium]|nr:MAG: aldehyde:ferredoxin oxidoreductase [Chloroflexota bacterium]MBA4375938.1 aldehyde ferredoxin oxidoreductase [Anaerolinea sp.]
MKAYTGKVLWVDLTRGAWTEESIPDSIYQKYLAGIGLGAVLLYRDMPVGADPLGPDNILGFMSGLLTGAGSLFTGRWMAVGKSPLTGTWGDSNCGGTLALAIKQCGYDGILFKGASDHPVYLYIDSKGPQLRDASGLWGKDAVETEDLLIAEHRHKKHPAVATIGQAGENLSLISGICNDRGRIAARSGLGAVMGSKKLKAVVLAGSRRVGAHDPIKTRLLSWKCSRDVMLPLKLMPSRIVAVFGGLIGRLPVGFTQNGLLLGGILAKWGTIGTLPASVGMGDTPFKNWAGTKKDMPQFNKLVDPDFVLKTEKRKYHCRGCPLGCGGIVELGGKQSHKMEYETAASFTSMLLNEDLELVYELNEMLNRGGMDSISAGGTVAFAMECYEKGWITRQDTGGIELTWGNGPAIREVVRQMIAREGFGAWLADGSKKAAQKLKPVALESAIQAGGQEMAYHDPRLDPGMALHASVDPTPGRHTTGAQLYYDLYKLWTRVPGLKPAAQFYPKESRYAADEYRMRGAVAVSNFTQFYNSAGACYMGMLIGVDRVPIFDWANSVTGWKLTPEQYMQIGHRIQTLRQMFNVREGIDPRSLKVSRRLLGDPPQAAGPNKGVSFDLDVLMKGYWQEIGWDPNTGIPAAETLEELEMEDVLAPAAGRSRP